MSDLILASNDTGVRDNYYEVLQNKITNKFESNRTKVKNQIQMLEREYSLLEDYLVPFGCDFDKLHTPVRFHNNGNLKISFQSELFNMHPHAVRQLGSKLGIPTKYLKDLACGENWQRNIAKDILNKTLENTEPERMLVRSVGDEVRGILSDQYRRFNSIELYRDFMSASQQRGAEILDANVDSTKVWIDMLMPEIFTVDTEKNGQVHMVFGVRMSNSDFGDGAVNLRSFMLQAVCLNGAVGESLLRQVHLGRKLPEDLGISQNTVMLDTEATASTIRDIASYVLSRENIFSNIHGIKKASGVDVDLEKEIKKLPKLGVTQSEAEETEKILLAGKPEDGIAGEGTLWKLAQAVSAVGRDSANTRRKELEEVSGQLMKLAA